MCQPYIESATTLSDVDDEELQEFHIFVSRHNGLPALSWTQKCECRLAICCSVLVSVCVWYTHLSWEN